MAITNFGSYCIDNVYSVPYFVKPGETLPCRQYRVHAGGKGLNQSLAMAYAGVPVRHAGKVGADGVWMKELLAKAGVDTSLTLVVETPSGHANIQVTPEGENAIVIYGGANQTIEPQDIERVLANTEPGDFLLIQNEISCLPELITSAHAAGQRIVFNAAPITSAVNDYPLEHIEIFIVNELEAQALTGESDVDRMLSRMAEKFPDARTLLTLGEQGAIYQDNETRHSRPAYRVSAVDSTGAGDTFTGYFMAGFVRGSPVEECLDLACRAAALCVTRPGAASSIPRLEEVIQAGESSLSN
jgi:ribokinase